MLGLGDLLFYGLVLLQPVGVIGLFGVATRMSHGHMATSVLIAMVAMMITAVSYGRMAALYPSAGSAYTYVGRGLNPHLGFLAGWAMVLDYLIIPVVNVIYGALSAERLVPAVPYWGWVLIIGLGMTLLNVRGIRWTARANQVLMAAMCCGGRGVRRCGGAIPVPDGGLVGPGVAGPVLRSRNVQFPRRVHGHVVCRGRLHRLRRHHHAGRRRHQPEADRAAGYRAGLPGDGADRRPPGVPGPARLAR